MFANIKQIAEMNFRLFVINFLFIFFSINCNSQSDTIDDVADLDFCVVHPDTELPVLTELFSRFKVALVYHGKQPKDIITRIDLIDYISKAKRG